MTLFHILVVLFLGAESADSNGADQSDIADVEFFRPRVYTFFLGRAEQSRTLKLESID